MSGRVLMFEGLPTSDRFYEMFSSHHATNKIKVDSNSNELQLPFIPYMKLRDPNLHSRNVPVVRNISKVSCDSDSTNDSFLPPSPISSTNNDSLLGLRPLNSPWSSTSSSPTSRTNSSKESFSDASEISHNVSSVRPVKKHSIFSIDSILSKSDTTKQKGDRPRSFSIKRISQLSAEQPNKRKRTEEGYNRNQSVQPNRNSPNNCSQLVPHPSLKTTQSYSNPATPVNHQSALLNAYVHDYYRMTLANQEATMACHGFPTPPITPRLGWPMSNIQNIQTPLMNKYGTSTEMNGSQPSIITRADGVYCSPPTDEEKGKRARTIFTTQQLERLEIEFSKQHYMVGTERYYLARQLNLKESQVKVWFQNRRIKWRKQKQQDPHSNESSQTNKKSNFATLREQALAKSN